MAGTHSSKKAVNVLFHFMIIFESSILVSALFVQYLELTRLQDFGILSNNNTLTIYHTSPKTLASSFSSAFSSSASSALLCPTIPTPLKNKAASKEATKKKNPHISLPPFQKNSEKLTEHGKSKSGPLRRFIPF